MKVSTFWLSIVIVVCLLNLCPEASDKIVDLNEANDDEENQVYYDSMSSLPHHHRDHIPITFEEDADDEQSNHSQSEKGSQFSLFSHRSLIQNNNDDVNTLKRKRSPSLDVVDENDSNTMFPGSEIIFNSENISDWHHMPELFEKKVVLYMILQFLWVSDIQLFSQCDPNIQAIIKTYFEERGKVRALSFLLYYKLEQKIPMTKEAIDLEIEVVMYYLEEVKQDPVLYQIALDAFRNPFTVVKSQNIIDVHISHFDESVVTLKIDQSGEEIYSSQLFFVSPNLGPLGEYNILRIDELTGLRSYGPFLHTFLFIIPDKLINFRQVMHK